MTLYSCTAALTCTTPLFVFPKDQYFTSLWFWFAGDYPARPVLFAATSRQPGLASQLLWRSEDGGRTFSPWAPGQHLLPAYGVAGEAIGIATNAHFPGRVLLWVSAALQVKQVVAHRGEIYYAAPAPAIPAGSSCS